MKLNRQAIMARYPHYFALRAFVFARMSEGLLKAYKRDLTLHDRRTLAATPVDVPWVAMVRESGTHLVRANESVRGTHDGRHGSHPPSVAIVWFSEVFSYERREWVGWDGMKMVHFTNHLRARAFLAFHERRYQGRALSRERKVGT